MLTVFPIIRSFFIFADPSSLGLVLVRYRLTKMTGDSYKIIYMRKKHIEPYNKQAFSTKKKKEKTVFPNEEVVV